MSNLVKIQNKDLSVKEFKGQRVVTFKDIDMLHERIEGTANKRFLDNKKHFIENVDYFLVPYKNFISNIEIPKTGSSIFDVANNFECPRGIDYSGYIYLAIDNQTEQLKIGRTKNKSQRISSLNTGRASKLDNFQWFECKDTLKAEKLIHEKLEQYKIRNEWYELNIEDAKLVITKTINDVNDNYVPRRHRGGYNGDITLLAESGYLMLVKSLQDDLAWKVQRELVNSYFRGKEQKQLSPMEQLRLQYQVIEQHEEKINELDIKVENLALTINISDGQAKTIQKLVNKRVKALCYGDESSAYMNTSIRKKVYSYIWRTLKDYLNVTVYHNILRKDYSSALKYVSAITLQGALLREIQEANRATLGEKAI